jgi:hypothetical protein
MAIPEKEVKEFMEKVELENAIAFAICPEGVLVLENDEILSRTVGSLELTDENAHIWGAAALLRLLKRKALDSLLKYIIEEMQDDMEMLSEMVTDPDQCIEPSNN